MKLNLIISVITITLLVVAYSNGRAIDDMCKRDLTRRILRMIGVSADSTPCLVQSKRDLAMLANSAIADIRERELDEVLGRMSYSRYDRRGFGTYDGKFCCSPSCDRYMAHLGISPAVVEC